LRAQADARDQQLDMLGRKVEALQQSVGVLNGEKAQLVLDVQRKDAEMADLQRSLREAHLVRLAVWQCFDA
jgi:hypothetical protein